MKLLAIEAGGMRISAAAFEGGTCVGKAFEEAPQRQTERLAPLVEGLLTQIEWKGQALDAIAVGRGPGSFTGLRSSMALGEGLGLGHQARLVGIDTLQAWAQASGQDRVAVALDGRRGQAYFGRFQKRAESWSSMEEPALLTQEEAWKLSAGWPLLSDLEAPQTRLKLPQGAELAVAVGHLALLRWQGEAGASIDWEPLYLRRAEAAILWEKLHPKAGA